MAEDLCAAFDAINSPDDETRTQAHNFINQQITENPDLYHIIFDIYNNSPENKHKIISLIVLKLIVYYNFGVVSANLADFSQLLGNSIEGSEDQSFYKYQVEIVLQIILHLGVVWEDFPTYLTLFQTHDNLIPFCVYLFIQCSRDRNIHRLYNDIFEELNHDILLRGLQYPNFDIQLYSTICFFKFVSKHNNIIPEQYEEHYNIICEIARNSSDLPEYNFNIFWNQLYRLHLRYLDPFYEIAKEFLNEGKELSPTNQLKLLNVLILDYVKLVPEDLEYIINTYFYLQASAEGIDFNEKIFENLSKVDFLISYNLLRSNLYTFLTNDDQDVQHTGLSLLDGFIRIYMSQIKGDISVLLDAVLQIAPNSFDNFMSMTKFILYYLQFNKFNYEDTQKIYDIVFKCFTSQSNVNFQYLARQISVKMGPDPCFFDNFLEIFEQIPIESLSVYFSLLLNLHSVENNMSDQKYEKFYEFLFEQFKGSSEKVDEIYQAFLQDQNNDDLLDELYNYALLRNSSSNLIYLFSVYNPSRFAELFESTIQCFVDLIQKDELRDNTNDLFSVVEIESDFTRVFKIDYERSIVVLKNFYEDISEGQDIDDLQHFLIGLDNSEYDEKKDLIDYYRDFRDRIVFREKMDKEKIIFEIQVVLKPVCKWMYKLNESEIQFLNGPFTNYEDNYRESNKTVPQIYSFILFLFNLAKSSYEMFIDLAQLIKIIVNPKRLNYNQENVWYNETCQKLVNNIQIFITKALPNINQNTYCSSFKALTNLMKVFIYTNCEFGHEYLTNIILPFYNNYQESSEIGLLDLFSTMIDYNFINQNEVDIMVQIISDIIKREESFYLDSRPSLILLLTKLSKLNNEVAPTFIEFVLQTFDVVKENPFLLDVKISCSYFLLSSFNQDNEQFQSVIPLLPDVISVFPSRKLINEFFLELKTFIENNTENFEKDLYEMLIHALIRFLSYQNNASAIFKFNQDFADCLIQMFVKLLEIYCQNCQIEDPGKLICEILADQPIAAQYILSLNQ